MNAVTLFGLLTVAASMYGRIMVGDKVVGFSMFATYTYNERAVEPHKQKAVRVKVASAPFARDARDNRADGWLLRHS